jgi:hypothetical protein
MNSDVYRHFVPAIIATAMAAMGLAGLLIVDHGPWNKPAVKKETMIQYGTTAASAAASAAVTPPRRSRSLLSRILLGCGG